MFALLVYLTTGGIYQLCKKKIMLLWVLIAKPTVVLVFFNKLSLLSSSRSLLSIHQPLKQQSAGLVTLATVLPMP